MTIDTKTLPEHPFTISYNSSSPGIASSDSNYTISFEDSLTNNPGSTVTTDSMPINIKIDDQFSVYNGNVKPDWPSELVIKDMINKYPGLKIQYEKFMTIYNLIKDEYEYEEPINDGSI